MKLLLLSSGILACTLFFWQFRTHSTAAVPGSPVQSVSGNFAPVAVLELFTSQGCSSCPPADALLAQTLAQAEGSGQQVFGLSFHVDYWNRLGWTDPYSQPAFSERQRVYAHALGSRVYTPQLVINGAAHVVGSNRAGVQQAIDQALSDSATLHFTKLEVQKSAGEWQLTYELQGDFSNCDLQVALVSEKVRTEVSRGENGGRSLSHVQVVRSLVSRKAERAGQVSLSLPPLEEPETLGLVVFARNRQSLRIQGAARMGR